MEFVIAGILVVAAFFWRYMARKDGKEYGETRKRIDAVKRPDPDGDVSDRLRDHSR